MTTEDGLGHENFEPAQQYIGVVPTLFGYGTALYEVENGVQCVQCYGKVDYTSESEAIAEAIGWSKADEVPLDRHALRLVHSPVSNSALVAAVAPDRVPGQQDGRGCARPRDPAMDMEVGGEEATSDDEDELPVTPRRASRGFGM